MKKARKLVSIILTSIMFMVILVGGKVLALDTNTKVIKNVSELSDAIKNQEDGQTWEIQAGTYVLTQDDLNKYSSWGTDSSGSDVNAKKAGQGNWYFPIHKNNITIKGLGNVVITSNVDTANGSWATQDFISIWGDNVTIDGINIKSKKDQNKAIEVMGKNVTLKNINLQKVNEDGSGSIAFNSQSNGDIGNATLENITLYSWISATYSKTGNLNTKNITIDFTDNSYAGYSDETAGYAWRPLINVKDGITLFNSNFKLLVDDKINLTEQVFVDDLPENTTIVLNEDVAVDKMINIKKDNVTLDLNNHTLTASNKFSNTWENNNDAHLLQVLNAENVTIKNGNIVTTEKNKHGINLYNADNVVLENLKIDNTKTLGGAPIIVNNSSATVKGNLDLTIGEKSWYGINVDPKDGEASLNFANGSKVSMTGDKNKTVIQLDGDDEKINISGADKAGLTTDDNGNFIIDLTPNITSTNASVNPNTSDNLIKHMVFLGISIIGICSVIYIKKRNA